MTNKHNDDLQWIPAQKFLHNVSPVFKTSSVKKQWVSFTNIIFAFAWDLFCCKHFSNVVFIAYLYNQNTCSLSIIIEIYEPLLKSILLEIYNLND